MIYRFNAEKNKKLLEERGISFDDIIYHIENGNLLDIIDHPNQDKYNHQKIAVVKIDNYVYLVPFINENDDIIFLKTAYPSRLYTRIYLKENKNG